MIAELNHFLDLCILLNHKLINHLIHKTKGEIKTDHAYIFSLLLSHYLIRLNLFCHQIHINFLSEFIRNAFISEIYYIQNQSWKVAWWFPELLVIFSFVRSAATSLKLFNVPQRKSGVNNQMKRILMLSLAQLSLSAKIHRTSTFKNMWAIEKIRATLPKFFRFQAILCLGSVFGTEWEVIKTSSRDK